MAAILKMVILGFVQGATEFLPVSSSAHLTIAQDLLGMTENRIVFDVFLHVGTLVAILLVFGRDLLALFSSNKRWIPYLALASVPGAVVGLSLRSHVEAAFNSLLAVGGLLVANSLILAVGGIAGRRKKSRKDVKTGGAFLVGVAQGAAILPGISRSGSTVCCGLVMGWERTLTVRFSFLLAIPAIMGAAGLEVLKSRSTLSSGDTFAVALTGLVVSAAAGYAALRLFLKTVQKGKLWVFSVYCFVVGVPLVLYQLVR